ncbi:hypothetical protein DPMN_188591 [Dreissena polymorpha]|uniref:Ubiquitin-like protease family profile domain-containing protein n=1 Tax=Dreissena polymorpha TaxID=45954 RepID=A0A9D4IBH1_DREPO|nr:hypothetical protein DPMN_188591 [Dreissena polymorpha]
MYDLLMLPQCKGNNHWVLLFASVMSRTVTIYDSLGGNNKALFDLFCQFMCQRAQIVNDGLEKIQFRVQSATLQQTAPWKQLWSVCIDAARDGELVYLRVFNVIYLSYSEFHNHGHAAADKQGKVQLHGDLHAELSFLALTYTSMT